MMKAGLIFVGLHSETMIDDLCHIDIFFYKEQ
jgi:hypothetical protein